MFKFSSLLFLASAALLVTALPKKSKRVTCPGNNQVTTNEACCVWFDVREDLLNNVFFNSCMDNVHGLVRLAFHDAAGFSQALLEAGQFPGGGADGSIVAFQDNEINTVAAFDGGQPQLDLIGPVQLAEAIANRHGVSFGDVIQFASSLGLTLCPGGPVVPFFAGRPNATAPAPPNLVALPDMSVTDLITRFEDMGNPGFSAQELVVLLGSHTSGGQDLQDANFAGTPFDSTPFIWDTQFYLETLLHPTDGDTTMTGGQLQETHVFRLASDAAFARDPRTACFWQQFVGNHQVLVNQFSQQMFRLSVVGQNVDELVDCSEVVPAQAAPLLTPSAFFPAGFTIDDIDQSCTDEAFPTFLDNGQAIETQSGPVQIVAPIPGQDTPNLPIPESSKRIRRT